MPIIIQLNNRGVPSDQGPPADFAESKERQRNKIKNTDFQVKTGCKWSLKEVVGTADRRVKIKTSGHHDYCSC